MNKKSLKFIFINLLLINILSWSGCGIYSFTGAQIHPDVRTVSVEDFRNLATLVAPALSATLTEKMKNKFTSETRLNLKNNKGDVQFNGSILNYFVAPAAAGARDQAAKNRLTIAVRVEYFNRTTNDTWSRSFQQFADFSNSASLSDVEGELINQITDKLADDIFNAAFSNW